MPQFSYIARSIDGQEKKGIIEAADEREIARNLHQEGYIVVSIEQMRRGAAKFNFSLFSTKVDLKEKLFFCRNLQVMLAAGVSLPRAIGILEGQTKNKTFKSALTKIREEITKGTTFSESLKLYPKIFSDFFINMIKVGEETGTMENSLEVAMKQMEKDYELHSKVKGAMIYPAVILIVMLGIGILMLTTTVPQLQATFADLNAQLPASTQFIINLSDFLRANWLAVALAAIFAVVFFIRFGRTQSGKHLFDNLTLQLPIISPIVKNINTAYTLRNISSLAAAGVSLTRALEVAAGTLDNTNYKNALLDVKERIKKGEKFSDAIGLYGKIYPPTAIQMIAVGEETGETSTILEKLAEFYETEVSEATKNLTAVIEPVLMVIIGIAVGFFAISMIQPMYSMMNAVE